MAFLKEKLSAFLAQPVEKKRSDHRLKKVQSTIDPRSWILDEELKRQQFLNVVNNTGDGGGGGVREEREGRDEHQPVKSVGQRVLDEDNVFQLEDKIKTLEEDKNFLKNVIADKENEIEQLLYRIRAMFEVNLK
ncbi:hypothetical protein J6590_009061 [Homalodisca vitripennis]|nr:hypothetical protein J6590_009061 [Homalodisca vitripennis]